MILYARGRPTVRPMSESQPGNPGGTPNPYLIFGAAKVAGVTGGAGGPTVVCNTYNQLYAQLWKDGSNANNPKIIKIPKTARIEGPQFVNNSTGLTEMTRGFYCGGNKTIIMEQGAYMNVGLWWWPDAESINANNNVIIRNLKQQDMWNVPGSDTKDNRDYLTFKKGFDKVWVDHCQQLASSGSDGCVDMGDVRSATLSYNLFSEEDKTNLLNGHNLTVAFNKYLNCTERQPSFGGPELDLETPSNTSMWWGSGIENRLDIFNNLYELVEAPTSAHINGYCIVSRKGSRIVSHGNVFKNIAGNPHKIIRDVIKGSSPVQYHADGAYFEYDNSYINCAKTNSNTYNTAFAWRPENTTAYHNGYLMDKSLVEAHVNLNAGQTLTDAQLVSLGY